ncbi:MAG: hypothetical protein ABF665_02895 [Gluconacetobacter sp.]
MVRSGGGHDFHQSLALRQSANRLHHDHPEIRDDIYVVFAIIVIIYAFYEYIGKRSGIKSGGATA